WRTVINRWARMNVVHKQHRHGQALPDRNDEYLLYQTLVGTWDTEQPGTPAFAEYRTRITNYMEKATREAKLHTSWVNPNVAYDTAMRQFVEAILDDRQRNRFLLDLDRFRQKVAFYGKLNALTQKLLLLTVPGVPDIYQGTELWDFSLVDPDNRRPVDFVRREVLLAQLAAYAEQAGEQLLPLAREVLDDWQDGRVKLFLVAKLLQLRQAQPNLFRYGGYTPLYAEGSHAAHVVAFQRHHLATHITVIAPRLIV
ncbi:MAG: malto-oligosyltrehalose synthase, partial [Cyanobacteria bacterium M5B4]